MVLTRNCVALDMVGATSAWSALEDLSLLNAVEIYSFGNWKDIAHHVGTRNANESKKEYVKKFLEGNIGKATWSEVIHCRPVLRNLVETNVSSAQNNACALPSIDIRPQEAWQLYYYPLRDEFEIEYDYQAESLVSSLTLYGDDDLDIALKLTLVDMYTERLRERKRRHRIVRDHQLIARFFRQTENPNKSTSKDERLLREKCRIFNQFYTGEEYEQFLGCLIIQRKLSRRLAELMRYRHFGLTSYDSLPEFEKQRLMRRKVSIELPLVESKRRKKIKNKCLLSAKKTCLGKRPFLSFGSLQ